MSDETHETTTFHGADDEGEWGAWVCITCGAAGADLGSHSDAIVAASQHRQEAS